MLPEPRSWIMSCGSYLVRAGAKEKAWLLPEKPSKAERKGRKSCAYLALILPSSVSVFYEVNSASSQLTLEPGMWSRMEGDEEGI